MNEKLHPAATQHLPAFITAPGETDVLMVVTGLFLVLAVLMFGIVFFRLHTLPERIAHRSKKIQFEIVAVLGLISLFTHMHIFWIAGLVLAFIDLPDFGTPLGRIAGATEKIAGIESGDRASETLSDGHAVDAETRRLNDVDGQRAARRESLEGKIEMIDGAKKDRVNA
jgi:hypothetical protein